jgi:hypothetical protein
MKTSKFTFAGYSDDIFQAQSDSQYISLDGLDTHHVFNIKDDAEDVKKLDHERT